MSHPGCKTASESGEVVHLAPGPWQPDGAASGCAVGLLLRDGFVLRTVHLAKRGSAEVLGPEDCVRLAGPSGDVLETAIQITALTPVTATVVGPALRATFGQAQLLDMLGLAEQQHLRATVHQAINHLPAVQDRVLSVLWMLAGRWGRVCADGVVVDVPLSHTELGCLVASRRPTVSIALKSLRLQGAVSRNVDGGWLLDQDSLIRVVGTVPVADLRRARQSEFPRPGAPMNRDVAVGPAYAEQTATRE